MHHKLSLTEFQTLSFFCSKSWFLKTDPQAENFENIYVSIYETDLALSLIKGPTQKLTQWYNEIKLWDYVF